MKYLTSQQNRWVCWTDAAIMRTYLGSYVPSWTTQLVTYAEQLVNLTYKQAILIVSNYNITFDFFV